VRRCSLQRVTPGAVNSVESYPSDEAVAFSAREAVPLAHALIDSLSRLHGLRSLAIKGPTLAFHGLRDERKSSDADVLASPEDFDALCAVLYELGWAEKATRIVPGALPSHSRSLFNSSWPTDIDVHRYYPGFFGNAQETFDFLWQTKVSAEFAHQQVWITGRPSSAVISALHSHRHPRSGRHQAELVKLTSILRTNMTAAELSEIESLVRVGRAQTVLAGFLNDIGVVEIDNDLSESEVKLWAYYRATHDDGATGGWLLAIQSARWFEKPAAIMRAVLPSPRELRAEREFVGLSTVGLVPVYWRRLKRGLSALPTAINAAFSLAIKPRLFRGKR
jgi:hypothetical protein